MTVIYQPKEKGLSSNDNNGELVGETPVNNPSSAPPENEQSNQNEGPYIDGQVPANEVPLLEDLDNLPIQSVDSNNSNPTPQDVDGDADEDLLDPITSEVRFPEKELATLDDMVNRSRWIVPVLPNGELEVLIKHTTRLVKAGLDHQCEPCQRFMKEGLFVSFQKILFDEAVSGWKNEIQQCIYNSAITVIDLCILRLEDDYFPVLNLLAMCFNPSSKYHHHNINRAADIRGAGPPIYSATSQSSQDGAHSSEQLLEVPSYAEFREMRHLYLLVDFINYFGYLGGFEKIAHRFQSESTLTLPLIHALIMPFGYCSDYLQQSTIEHYFVPIVEIIVRFLKNLSDNDLKKEAKTESKNDVFSGIIKNIQLLIRRLPNMEEEAKNMEVMRLDLILRVLQVAPFNGKMNALIELNKLILPLHSLYTPHSYRNHDPDVLSATQVAQWLQKNDVLGILLRENLHQPQYVEKLEKIVRFLIKEDVLTQADLDRIWDSQEGKHEAIVKNIHDLLAKLAWDFAPDQLDYIFKCFQISWTQANHKKRERLIQLIRKLSEEDKDGVMAGKVLGLLWDLALAEDCPLDIMERALQAHTKILDYSCVQDREAQRLDWVIKLVNILKNSNHPRFVIPCIKQIVDIISLFPVNFRPPVSNSKAPQNYSQCHTRGQIHRTDIVSQIQKEHSVINLVVDKLAHHTEWMRKYKEAHPEAVDSESVYPDGRYSHIQHVNEPLQFICFILREGMLYLYLPEAVRVWECLAVNAVFPQDREACFRWFVGLMKDEQDLEPDCMRNFFVDHVLKFEPALLTTIGMGCFELFFRHVNLKANKLKCDQLEIYMEDIDLIGVEYLWKSVISADEEVANQAIVLLRDLNTNLGKSLLPQQRAINEDFIQHCLNRLQAGHDTVGCLHQDDSSRNHEFVRMSRVMTVLREFLCQCDCNFSAERAHPPLSRSWCGRSFTVIVRLTGMSGRGGIEETEVTTHTNETVGHLRNKILSVKVPESSAAHNFRVDLYYNNSLIDLCDDHRLVTYFRLQHRSILTGKVTSLAIPGGTVSSESSSGDSSRNTSPRHHRRHRSGGGLGLNVSGAGFGGITGLATKDLEARMKVLEMEQNLPGVMMAQSGSSTEFLFKLADLADEFGGIALRSGVNDVLTLMSPDETITRKLREAVHREDSNRFVSTNDGLSRLLSQSGPTQTLYIFQVLYHLMLPASAADEPDSSSLEFTESFIRHGGLRTLLDLLGKNNFLAKAALPTRKEALLWMMRLLRLCLTCIAFAYYHVVAELASVGREVTAPMVTLHSVLKAMLQVLPSAAHDYHMRDLGYLMGQRLRKRVTVSELDGLLPDQVIVKAIMKIAWAAGSASIHLMYSAPDDIHRAMERALTPLNIQMGPQGAPSQRDPPSTEDSLLARESLECLTVCVGLCPSSLEGLMKEKAWQTFITDMVILSKSREIRYCAQEQFVYMATKCSLENKPLIFFIQLLFTVLNSQVKTYSSQTMDYFTLLERLLEFTRKAHLTFMNIDTLLTNELQWLKKVRDDFIQKHHTGIEETLLQGHLKLSKELIVFQNAERKFEIGSKESSLKLIEKLLDDFIFPASKQVLMLRQSGEPEVLELTPAICNTPMTIGVGYELLVALVSCCLPNMTALAERLIEMYYQDPHLALTEWEYVPAIGPRPYEGFVGLKNGGATCYMNSILQQLFMIPPLRDALLSADTGECDYVEDEDGSLESLAKSIPRSLSIRLSDDPTPQSPVKVPSDKDTHNLAVLRHVQVIFGHLAYSKMQFYVPRGFWKQFKLWGDSVNLREQHDALEFFNCLVDNVDEALRTLSLPKVVERVMGGSFADQKICIDCPHRYSREESFTTLNVDIRNHHNLFESLEQYVKGDLLEGDNAYMCENCAKKVDTVKRLCIKRLPLVLAIQLKRFDYDWERDTAIKFNDYFEFPRELDMDPYTAAGLARLDGQALDGEADGEDGVGQTTRYTLRGVVVHSGQASGGHYYSYIRTRKKVAGGYQWFKFDDQEVTEVKMDDPEEMQNQWFGGEFVGEVFDHMIKRPAYRKQKRWWNAYILFYEREDFQDSKLIRELSMSFKEMKLDESSPIPIPSRIERMVQRQNIEYTHNKAQFTQEYFLFMKRLAVCHQPELAGSHPLPEKQLESLSTITLDLLIRFLFSFGFRTKKILRGPASEWLEALKELLKVSPKVRHYFAEHVFFQPGRISEYLLECSSPEIRSCFAQLIVYVAHHSREPPFHMEAVRNVLPADVDLTGASLSHCIMLSVLVLLKKEVMEYARHFTQYFRLFVDYLSCGAEERRHLLSLSVPVMFISFALDEGPGQPVRYGDLGKLVSTVSLLIRCCDVSAYYDSKKAKEERPMNRYRYDDGDPNGIFQPLAPLCESVAHYLYDQPNRFIKKMLEDSLNVHTYFDIAALIKFLCYENRCYSQAVLDELIWMVTFSYSTELRLYLELTCEILLIEDHWTKHRLVDTLKGHDDVDPLLDTLLRVKSHQQKRSYHMMKMLVRLFQMSPEAASLLNTDHEVSRKFRQAVEWLNDELERRSGREWTSPGGHHVQSNDVSNTYYIERSNSALSVLDKGIVITQTIANEEDQVQPENLHTGSQGNATQHFGVHSSDSLPDDQPPSDLEPGAVNHADTNSNRGPPIQ